MKWMRRKFNTEVITTSVRDDRELGEILIPKKDITGCLVCFKNDKGKPFGTIFWISSFTSPPILGIEPMVGVTAIGSKFKDNPGPVVFSLNPDNSMINRGTVVIPFSLFSKNYVILSEKWWSKILNLGSLKRWVSKQ